MKGFENKIAIVTGGGMGLGRALCEELAANGAQVIVVDINQEAANTVANGIARRGGKALPAHVDVSRSDQVGKLVESSAQRFGRIDYVINNAALVIGGDTRDLSLEQWESVLRVDLHGEMYGALAAYPVMVQQGFGHIVNVSSLGGLIPQPCNTPYSTSKWGLVGFSLGLRFEGADLGVKVSCVCPGDMKTDIYDNMTVVNMHRDQIVRVSRQSHFLMPQWSAQRAAREILRGVLRNKPMIVFPGIVRWIWRLQRFLPAVVYRATAHRVRMLRKVREDYLHASVPDQV